MKPTPDTHSTRTRPQPAEARVRDLLSRMTLEEKAAQMVARDRGAHFRYPTHDDEEFFIMVNQMVAPE